MPTTTKGLKGFKSTGNPLLDALMVMSLVPGTGGMAADEEIGKDLGAIFNKLKPFKQGGEELPEASVEGVENILKVDPKAAKGANVPEDPAERARLIQEYMAKQKGVATPATAPASPSPALEQLASPSPAKAVRAAKAAPKGSGKPGEMQMSLVNQRFVHSIDEAMRHDLLDPAEKTKQIYQYLKGKLPDTPTRAYGWDKKIKAIDTDIDAYMKPDAFKKLSNHESPEERELNNWRINQLRERYHTALKQAQDIFDNLSRIKR